MVRRPKAEDAVLPRFRRLLRTDRGSMLAAMRHPLRALAFELRGSARFGAYLASNVARELVGEATLRDPIRRDLTALWQLQDELTALGKRWASFDPSNMIPFKGPLLYFLIRLLRPRTVVETGVASGISTAHILQALHNNGGGVLVSIDLPGADPSARVPEAEGSGWIVPHRLRKNWDLVLGDVRVHLPEVLARFGSVDMFVHDSLHTYAHMLWEFETAWSRLSPGGILVSDDVDQNAAFEEFSRSREGVRLVRYGFGMMRKGGIGRSRGGDRDPSAS